MNVPSVGNMRGTPKSVDSTKVIKGNASKDSLYGTNVVGRQSVTTSPAFGKLGGLPARK